MESIHKSIHRLFGSFKNGNAVRAVVQYAMVAVLCFNTSVGISQPVSSSVKVECLLDIARMNLNVTENPLGSNWGEEIKYYLSYCNLKTPNPWCAAFVCYCLSNVGCDISHPKFGLVAMWSKNEWAANVVIDSRKSGVNISPSDVKPGDIFTIYYSNLKRDGHIGIVEKIEGGKLVTIEGNTNSGGSREGIGVYRRTRSLNSISKILRFL